jgi:hypothetical protein
VTTSERQIVEIDVTRTPLGARHRRTSDLTSRERACYDAQLAAYRTAVALIAEIDAYRDVGQYQTVYRQETYLASVKDHEARWQVARETWRRHRGQ